MSVTDSLTEKVALEAVTPEMLEAATDIPAWRGDEWINADLLPQIYLAMRALDPAIATLNTEPSEAAEVEFTRYFVRNYPQDTTIYNPKWHAPKIFRAAMSALRSSTSGSDQRCKYCGSLGGTGGNSHTTDCVRPRAAKQEGGNNQ